jgi:shikimate kinase
MSITKHQNIVLIGMPGAGKSTIGVILAKLAGMSFLDSDVTIQTTHHKTLQEIMDESGYMELRRIEEEVLLGLDLDDHVLATGGSAAYSEPAMMHLKKNGIVLFLEVSLATLEKRIHNFATRGLAKRDDQSFEDLFDERMHLYHKYADIHIDCGDMSQEDLCDVILKKVNAYKQPWTMISNRAGL